MTAHIFSPVPVRSKPGTTITDIRGNVQTKISYNVQIILCEFYRGGGIDKAEYEYLNDLAETFSFQEEIGLRNLVVANRKASAEP